MKLKNILLSSLVFGGLMFSSCTGFLDEDSNPNTLSPSVFWKMNQILKKAWSVFMLHCSQTRLGQLL